MPDEIINLCRFYTDQYGMRINIVYNAMSFVLTESEDLFYKTSAVTHWMPLPEPPEKDVTNNEI